VGLIDAVKVMHLESGRHLYGGARQVEHLLAGLVSHAVESVLVCRPGAALARRSAAAVIELPMHGELDWLTVRRVRRLLRSERPDVLHVHSRGGADVFGGLAARAERIPALVTRRVDRREPRAWARPKFDRFAAIAAISSPIRTWLVDGLGLPAARVVHIASAVDPACFAERARARAALARRFDLASGARVIGTVGQLIPRKGHDVLLAAAAAILAAEPRARFLIFGRGPLEAKLRAAIARGGLADRVRLVGHDPELAGHLAGFDLLLHPARAEGLGLAVLEAMSCGVPVVASRVGGLVDLVDDGTTGMLVARCPTAAQPPSRSPAARRSPPRARPASARCAPTPTPD
jgi:glycosyltransferase involved in cell wall biosynthesis